MRHPAYRDYLAEHLPRPVVHVEITSKCNFRCDYCISPHSPRTKEFMAPELFAHILPQLDGLTTEPLRFHIDGEPTLHPHFHEFARQANARGHRIALATNGTALKPDYLGLELNLRIHLSTSPAELATRSNLPFETYITKLSDYVRAWTEADSPQYIGLFLYYEQEDAGAVARNEYRSEFLRGFLERCGLDPDAPSSKPVARYLHRKPDGYSMSIRQSAIARGGVYGKADDGDLAPSRHGFCDSAWKTLAILADGRVSYCCVDLTGATAYTEPGEIWETPLRDLWLRHAAIDRVRNETLAAEIHNPTCQSCLTSVDYCPNREFYAHWGPPFDPDAAPGDGSA